MDKKKILIVDDEPDILFMLQSRLEAHEYDVVIASNGEEALEKARAENPDIILLDVMMPPPNGFQVCRTLKDDPAYKHIPVIMLTAKTTESDQFWGLESGADGYVTKPYNSEELLSKIAELLSA
jgi:two-component system, OmpR family, alkaline phosphatase synthesis response regulator PhoP